MGYFRHRVRFDDESGVGVAVRTTRRSGEFWPLPTAHLPAEPDTELPPDKHNTVCRG